MIKVIRFPVFAYRVHVEVGDIKKNMQKYPPCRVVSPEGVLSGLCVHLGGEPITYMFLPEETTAGTIAHESWHAVRRMLSEAGVELDSEVVAYHIGYLVNEITGELFGNRHRRKRRNKVHTAGADFR